MLCYAYFGWFFGIALSVIRVEWVSAFCMKRQVIHREYIEPMNWTYIIVQSSPTEPWITCIAGPNCGEFPKFS